MSELLVLWDVDYTLVNADGLGTRMYETVFRELFGRDLLTVASKAGRTDRAILLDTLALAGIAEPRVHVDDFLAVLARQSAAAGGRVRHDVRAMPGASAALAALADVGARQSVLTGNVRPLAELKLGLAGLGEHLDLDVGAYGDMHEVRAELVPVARQAAGQAYGSDFGGRSTVLVGDTSLDVTAALAAGARAVGVATGSFSADELAAAGAHVVLPDLTDTSLVLAAVTGQPLPGIHGDLATLHGPGGRPRVRRPGAAEIRAGRDNRMSMAVAGRPSHGPGAPWRLRPRWRTAPA